MTQTKIYCDHCGKELDDTKDFGNTTIDYSTSYLHTDLCQDCFDKLVDWLYSYCKQGNGEE